MDLLAFLLHHRFGVTRTQIFAKVRGYQGQDEESARRKFERDKADLEALGIRIDNVPARDESGVPGYRLRVDGVYLPQIELAGTAKPDRPYQALRSLQLSNDELDLLDRATRRLAQQPETGWAEAAKSLRRKLEFDLPLESLSSQRALATPLGTAAAKSLAALQDAVATHRAVSCQHWSLGASEAVPVEVDPYSLLFQWGRWYCAGWDRDHDRAVILAVEDLDAVEPLGAEFKPRKEFDVRALIGRAPWEWGGGAATVARVRVTGPAARWAANRKFGKPLNDLASDGGVTLEMTVRDRPVFLRWALSLGRKLRIEEPPALAAELESLRGQVAAIYGAADR